MVEKRFRALRFIGILLKILAWVILLGGIVSAAFVFVTGMAGILNTEALGPIGVRAGIISGVVAGLGILFASLVYFLVFYALGDSIYLQISIEENTRLTAVLLRQISEQDAEGTAPPRPVT